ncbi:MAG: hypothetical protein ACW99U_14965 [Candidatus Thorarchaeota archaeon]
MKRQAFVLGTSIFVILNLLLLTFTPIPAQAAEVWSDNFNDGNYDGWTTLRPDNFTASNGYLENTYNATSVYDRPYISYENDVNNGTWSYDAYVAHNYMIIMFWYEPSDFCALWHEVNGADIIWNWDTKEIWTSPVGLMGVWTHFDITLSSDPFYVDVFVDGTHRLHYEPIFTPTGESEEFTFWGVSEGDAIDNVVVSDSFDIECDNGTCDVDHYEPPTTTTTTPTDTTETTTTTTDDTTTPPPPADIPMEFIALGVAVPVVIVVLVVGLRMRRS